MEVHVVGRYHKLRVSSTQYIYTQKYITSYQREVHLHSCYPPKSTLVNQVCKKSRDDVKVKENIQTTILTSFSH